jgi:hypothetical protein
MSVGLRRNHGEAKIALLEQALRRAELSIRRMFSAVNPNVGAFSPHDIN